MMVESRAIAVRAPNWIGDAVMSMPLAACVRRNAPRARLVLVVKAGVVPVYRDCPHIDDILEVPHGAGPAGIEETVRRLRPWRFDAAWILPNSFKTAAEFLLAGVPERIGYRRDARGLLLTRAVPRPSANGRFRPTYMADYYLGLAEAAGLSVAERLPRLWIDDDADREAARRISAAGLDPDGGYILLSPGASYGPAKLWPHTHWARLAESLAEETGRRIGVISGPVDQVHADRIRELSRTPIADLTRAGIDLHLLKGVVRRCGLMVTTDSGPRHYGIALRRPTVCVMGPNHPEYSTTKLAIDRVVQLDVACGPCQQKTCPEEHHRCMRELAPELVLRACEAALTEWRRSRETEVTSED